MSDGGKLVKFPDLQGLEAEATAWIVKVDGGAMSEQDWAALNAWQDQSAQHREALRRASEFWDGLDVLKELDNMAKDGVIESAEDTESTNAWWDWAYGGSRLRLSAIALAATGLLLAVAVVLQTFVFDFGRPGIYRTAIGEQRSVALTDGSEILLNTNTVVEVLYSDEARNVRLLKGEAHFEVAKDADRPFQVTTGQGAVQAIGTAFSVRLLEEKIEVTVTEGNVEIRPYVADIRNIETPAISRRDVVETPNVLQVSAGQNAIFGLDIEQVNEISPVDLNRKLAWHQGMLAFEGAPLSQVVDDISRYTDVSIVIRDADLQDLPVGGFFKVGEVDALFEALEQGLGLRVSRVDNRLYVISGTN